jgi:hypothetical protein
MATNVINLPSLNSGLIIHWPLMWNNTPPCIKYIPTKYEGTGPFKTKFFDEQSIIELIGQDKSDLILIHDIPPCPNAYTKYEDTCDKIVLLWIRLY